MKNFILSMLASGIATLIIIWAFVTIFNFFRNMGDMPQVTPDHRVSTRAYEFLVFYELSAPWWSSLIRGEAMRNWATNRSIRKVEQKLKRYYAWKDFIDTTEAVQMTTSIINEPNKTT